MKKVMKKYIFFLLLLFTGVSASARTNVYDLRSFHIGAMPVYLTTPDRAQEILGKPEHREGYLNARGGYAVYPYMGFSPWWGPWGPSFGFYAPYYGRPELLGTMVLIYDKLVIYFDQKVERGEAYITNANLYTPDYPLYYGDTAIRVGDSFESLASVFPDEFRKAAKKSKKEVFFLNIKVDAGAGAFRQKGKITFIMKDMRIDAIQIALR